MKTHLHGKEMIGESDIYIVSKHTIIAEIKWQHGSFVLVGDALLQSFFLSF